MVQNRLNLASETQLDAGPTSGTVVGRSGNAALDVPTTCDRFDDRLSTVNARFGTAETTPGTPSCGLLGFPGP